MRRAQSSAQSLDQADIAQYIVMMFSKPDAIKCIVNLGMEVIPECGLREIMSKASLPFFPSLNANSYKVDSLRRTQNREVKPECF